jgi:NADH:ubiquinone oxidoreductase subunit H
VAAEVTRDVEQAFSGPDGEHATFRGSVEAAFFPLAAGMPPVTGGLAAAVFDVVPLGGEPTETRVAEARRFAEFAGVLFAENGSLVVDGVMPRSPAERAGVSNGDRFSELAGLRVLGRTDLAPPPRARKVELVVHRNGVADPVRLVLETDGFQRLTPRDLAAACGVLAAALALFASLRSPLGRALSFLELRLVEVLRVRRERRRTRELERGKRRRMPGFLHAVLPSSAAAYLALAAATGVVVFLGMGGAIVAREVDLAVIAAATLASVTASALVFGAPGERGVALRLRRVALVLGQGLPLVAAVACAAVETGGIGLDELAREQGALPWQWFAFRSPVLLCATLVFFAALVPEAARGSTDGVALPGEARRPIVRAASELVGWTELVVACGIAAFAFFGGARTQALGPAPDAPLGSALFGAAAVVVKTLALLLSVLFARAVVGRLDLSETRGMTFRVLLPVAVFAALATLVLQRAEVRPMATPVAATLGLSCFVGVALLAASFARRVVAGAAGRDAEPGVNPWI